MKNIGLILDSTSNRSKKELEKKEIAFIPIPITIDDHEFLSGVDINTDEITAKFKNNPNIKIRTSSPMPKHIIEAFDKILETHDEAIYIGLSKKFSSTLELVKNIAQSDDKYNGKIHVFDSKYSAPWTSLIIDDLLELVKTQDIETIFEILKIHQDTLIGYLSPGDIVHFYNGGRITKIQYRTAKLLRIKPILIIRNGFIEQKETLKSTSIDGIIKKVFGKFDSFIKNVHNLGLKEVTAKDLWFLVLGSQENFDKTKAKIIANDYIYNGQEIIKMKLDASQTGHMGPDSFGIAYFLPLNYVIKKITKGSK